MGRKTPEDAKRFRDELIALLGARVRKALANPCTLEQIASSVGEGATPGMVLDVISALRGERVNVIQLGDRYCLHHAPVNSEDRRFSSSSDDTGLHRFGFISDNHYGSKYAREEVGEEIYDWFVAEGITEVFNCGNWIEGEARFNRMDLIDEAHGMTPQLRYAAAKYPRRKGVTTRYVAGDDHEGWYAQREKVDIGVLWEDEARRIGREDLVYLGYKEAFVDIQHAAYGTSTKMLVDHPGGGSTYALSYRPQKLVESLQGGEKPGIWCMGHYHKQGYFVARGVHTLLIPSVKDQDTFLRKKGIDSVVGGVILEVRQDEGGAIEGVTPRFKLYRDRGYYNLQWEPAR